MKIENVRFIKSASKPDHYPDYSYPEFAFLGRSNSGKSSLINSVTGRKRLVKTGSTPGMTRTVNFFLMNENISIADLPGYGYAKVAKTERDSLSKMIEAYIASGRKIKLAFLLMDIRRDPDESESGILSRLSDNNIPSALVLTKCDKISRVKRKGRVEEIASLAGIGTESIIVSSTLSGEGRRELLGIISQFSRSIAVS